MDDTQQLPGQQTLDALPAPMDRAAIDNALRGPANGHAGKPARGPGGQFVKKSAADTPPAAAAATMAQERELEAATPDQTMSSAQTAEVDEPCDDCPPDVREGDFAPVLGYLVLGAAAVLAYIGFDLATRGGLSRRLGGGRWDDEE